MKLHSCRRIRIAARCGDASLTADKLLISHQAPPETFLVARPDKNPNLFLSDSLLWFPFFVTITEEISKRRTFAIISHPDAGKTTLTEKLLLYGGAVQLAGSVTARRNQRPPRPTDGAGKEARASPSVPRCLQFDYNGYRLNLLDTPATGFFRGHLPCAHGRGFGGDGD